MLHLDGLQAAAMSEGCALVFSSKAVLHRCIMVLCVCRTCLSVDGLQLGSCMGSAVQQSLQRNGPSVGSGGGTRPLILGQCSGRRMRAAEG